MGDAVQVGSPTPWGQVEDVHAVDLPVWSRGTRAQIKTVIGAVNGMGLFGAKIVVTGGSTSWRYTVSVEHCTAKGWGYENENAAKNAGSAVAHALLVALQIYTKQERHLLKVEARGNK